VRAFSGKDLSELTSFIAYDTASSGGLLVAAGHLDHDGPPDLIAAGQGVRHPPRQVGRRGR
jgi:hypothetical protein